MAALIRPYNERCGDILLKFKREICHNPYADVTPYTRMIADEFIIWSKEREKEIINLLFLDLYARDVRSLRRDLCKFEPQSFLSSLETLETSKAKFPKRVLLLCQLYRTLSLFVEYDFFGYIAACEQIGESKYEAAWEKYEIARRKYEIELILLELSDEICLNPNTEVSLYSVNLIELYYNMEKVYENRVIKTLLQNLYAHDSQSLDRDLNVKIPMLGQVNVPLNQRAELLAYLYGALASYIGEDFSSLIVRCDNMEKIYHG